VSEAYLAEGLHRWASGGPALGGGFVAGVDVGTTRVKLAVFDEEGEVVESFAVRSPLVWRRGLGVHDAASLRRLVLGMVERALRRGAVAVGVSVYRASVARWGPGGRPSSPIVLWLDRVLHLRAWRALPRAARLLSRAPLLGRAFSPLSPLPVIRFLWRGARRGERVWTVDALVSEWLGAGFVSEPGSAALTGLVDPWSLRPLGLVAAAAGLRGLPFPRVGENVLPDRPRGVAALAADQQAAVLGSPCRPGGGCVKLSLGTGFFADLPLPGRPPRLLGQGLIPVVLYRVGDRVGYGVESMAPGAGLALESMAGAVGGLEALRRLGPGDCRRGWDGGLVLPFLGGPAGKGLGPDRVVALGSPGLRGGRDLACSLVAGAAVAAMLLLSLHGPAISRVYLTGGASRIPLLRGLIAASFPGETLLCREDTAPRGAAMLAAQALEAELPAAECSSLGRGRGGYREAAGLLQRLLRARRPGEADEALQGLRRLVEDLL